MQRLLYVAALFTPTAAHAQNEVAQPFLGWMAWTWQTGAFFGIIAAALLIMTVWEIAKPGGNPRSSPRRTPSLKAPSAAPVGRAGQFRTPLEDKIAAV